MIDSIKTFGIIGGDRRQLYLAQSLLNDGFGVLLAGFDRQEGLDRKLLADAEAAVRGSDAVLLPLPAVRADKSLNAPFAAGDIFFSDAIQEALCGKPVFAGMRDRLLRACPRLDGAGVYDYAAREDFAVLNAVPTAEGAVELAMHAFDGTIRGSRSLVTGFGRIGRLLAQTLSALGSRVTVTARKPADLAMIEAMGCRALNTERLRAAIGYDLIFNTVPAMIFDRRLLENTSKGSLLTDLASLPGGVDFESARSLGIDARRALALPGKCAPKSAGEIIKRTVFSIIEEVNR